MRDIVNHSLAVVLAAVVFMGADPVACQARARNVKSPVMDLTQGGKPDASHDWTLGATGARGWMWGWKGHTFEARQILVTAVAAGSPADGVLAKGDVILGLAGKPFAADARIRFARALTEAEKNENRGLLKLIRWRAGKTDNVVVKLAVMGDYSPTAPYNCPKSKRIFEQGCRTIAKKGLDKVAIPNHLNALALLASGRREYRPMLAEYAKRVAVYETVGMATWNYGYANMFLAEYYMATHDKSILGGVKRLAMESARGQSNVGTWGHKFARPDGILNGYGAMNQPGLSLTISMMLARQAGVKDPVLDRAIAKASRFLHWYANKGAIPYGDHEPWPDHDDNGKCSSAAVMFDLLGDAEAAGFFARMGTAAWAERESGHTGNFFNVLWAMPGVSRCGEVAAAAYFKQDAWYYDLARKFDGSFVYQGTPGNWGGHAYRNWDSTGAYLLAYALPLRSLYITGKKPSCAAALTPTQVAETIDADRGFNFWIKSTCYDSKTTPELLKCLTSWSPAVRTRAAGSLSRRDDNVVPQLVAMVDGKDVNARYGACEAFLQLGPKAAGAAAKLRELLGDKDPWVRQLAARAVSACGIKARKVATTSLLKLADTTTPDDPRGIVNRGVAKALFAKAGPKSPTPGILSESLEGADRKLLYPAIRQLLKNEDSAVRGRVGRIYGKLTDKDLQVLLPDIVAATVKMAPSNTMFADHVRVAGLDLFSSRHITEGMRMCVAMIEPDRWGMKNRCIKSLEYLGRYRKAARAVLPALRKIRDEMAQLNTRGKNAEFVKAVEKRIADIQAETTEPKLQTIAEFMRKPAKP